METFSQSVSQRQPRSFWAGWLAWVSVIIVLVWSFGIDFLLTELKGLSFYHMVIWVVILLISFVLFLVAVIVAIGDVRAARQDPKILFRKKLIGRIVLGGVGLLVSSLLIFLYGLLVLTVGSNL